MTTLPALRPLSLLVVVLAVVGLAVTGLVAPARSDVSDTITVVKEGETLENVEIVARLAEATFDEPTNRVLIGREDLFADNIASSVMQTDSPLLLAPSDGPLSQRVKDLLAFYDPSEVVLLGGEAALGPDVEAELAADYTVTRRFGPTRFETAIDIARTEAGNATTAIMARAFAAPDANDESQAFADALAAGGWAADMGWPILLTGTEELPGSVETYLRDSDITQMMIMGGTAAVSAAVEERLVEIGISTERIAGADRFATAVEVAKERGVENATDAGRVVLVEGQAANAWAGGFAAASHSAVFDAPVVLVNGEGIPGVTTDFLTPPAGFAQAGFFDNAVLTCAAAPEACRQARIVRGLPPEAGVTFDPPDGSLVAAGSPVTVTVQADGQLPHEVTGPCITDTTGTAPGSAVVTITTGFTGTCTLTSLLTLPSGAIQSDTATYTVEPAEGGILTSASNLEHYTYVPGDEEILVEVGPDDTFFVDGQAATPGVWFQEATVGDFVVQEGGFAQTGVAHRLTNRSEEFYSSGVVGDVDVSGEVAAIIEPVSGYALRGFPFDDALYTVDGIDVNLATFSEDVSEGDQVVLGENASMVPTIDLLNRSVSGPAVQISSGSGVTVFRIDSGGLPDSPLIGDDPLSDNDLHFEVVDGSMTQDLLVDGDPATYDEFNVALTEGDMVTYSRIDDVETFALVNVAGAGTTGLATEDYDLAGGAGAPFTLLVPGQGRRPFTVSAGAQLLVDNVLVTAMQFEAAYSPGDQVTVIPVDGSTPQQIRVSNRALTGNLGNVMTGPNTYDVVNSDGIIYDNVDYIGDAFGGTRNNRYFVDGTEVTLMDFETALDAADLSVASIRVNRGGDPGVSPDNEHRLFTS